MCVSGRHIQAQPKSKTSACRGISGRTYSPIRRLKRWKPPRASAHESSLVPVSILYAVGKHGNSLELQPTNLPWFRSRYTPSESTGTPLTAASAFSPRISPGSGLAIRHLKIWKRPRASANEISPGSGLATLRPIRWKPPRPSFSPRILPGSGCLAVTPKTDKQLTPPPPLPPPLTNPLETKPAFVGVTSLDQSGSDFFWIKVWEHATVDARHFFLLIYFLPQLTIFSFFFFKPSPIIRKITIFRTMNRA